MVPKATETDSQDRPGWQQQSSKFHATAKRLVEAWSSWRNNTSDNIPSSPPSPHSHSHRHDHCTDHIHPPPGLPPPHTHDDDEEDALRKGLGYHDSRDTHSNTPNTYLQSTQTDTSTNSTAALPALISSLPASGAQPYDAISTTPNPPPPREEDFDEDDGPFREQEDETSNQIADHSNEWSVLVTHPTTTPPHHHHALNDYTTTTQQHDHYHEAAGQKLAKNVAKQALVQRGVSHTGSFPPTPILDDSFFGFLKAMNSSSLMPTPFTRTDTFDVVKKAAPHLPDALVEPLASVRKIHMFGALAKAFLKSIAMSNDEPSWPRYQFGSINGRRVEEAVLIEKIKAHRLATAGITSFLHLFDVKNVHPSISGRTLYPTFNSAKRSQDRAFLCQCIAEHHTLFHAIDCDHLLLAPVLTQGWPLANSAFNCVCALPSDTYIDGCQVLDATLTGTNPLDNSEYNIAHTTLIDDVASRIACDHSWEVPIVSMTVKRIFEDALDEINVAQNADKLQPQVRPFGPGAREVIRDMARSSSFPTSQREARYLGPYLHWKVSTTFDIERRKDAGRKAFYASTFLWTRHCARRLKLRVFLAVVYSTLTSGLVAFVLTKADYHELDVFVDRHFRKLLRRAATKKSVDLDGHVTNRSEISASL